MPGSPSRSDPAPSRRRGLLPDRLALPATVAFVLALAVVSGVLAAGGWEPSRLVHAGEPWTTDQGKPDSLVLGPPDQAFDGQFFYRLGVAPWSGEERVAGVQFDLPSLRSARWLYGAAAYPASGGDADLVPWALIGLNLVAALACGAVGGALARASGIHAGWGLLLALYPGFVYSLSLDTSELVASVFVLAGLLAARRRRWALGAVALSLGLLTRDTTAVVAAGLLLAAVSTPVLAGQRRPALGEVVLGAVPLGVFVLWQAVQRVRFGTWPVTSSGQNNLGPPFQGLAEGLSRLLPPAGGADLFRLLSMAVLAFVLVTAAAGSSRSSAPGRERVAWVPAVLVVTGLSFFVWEGATGFMRAGSEAYLLSVLVILGLPRVWRVVVTVPVIGLWFLTAAAQIAKAL